ncbi:hypothetical protein V493_07419 [Pseudogymnoascus sp. VKM F-4281 (FW-2241)]|nr:hypothetical protein V493_07419 [Pseudogymnoascus sp. VKM F-4281 (FW-2241)]
MARARTPRLFRIFYTTLYTLLALILLGLLIIAPADAIRQALTNRQLYNVFVISTVYFLTALLALLFYASRLYTTRTILASIPKPYLPLTPADLPPKVHTLIRDALRRSALVAWNARPHTPATNTAAVDIGLACPLPSATIEPTSRRLAKHTHRLLRRRRRRRREAEAADAALMPTADPVWGPIAHAGWSSPTSPDLPNLHYAPVIAELPHLIEAKAVALSGATAASLALLPRPVHAGLREYVLVLLELKVLDGGVPWREFVEGYEEARFSGRAVSEGEFRGLMGLFAEVLRGVRPLGGGPVEDSESEMEEEDEDDDDEGADESLISQEGSIRRGPIARYDGGYDAMPHEGLGIQMSERSTPSTPRGRRPRSASLSPSESWVSLSNGSFASGGSVVRHPELGSGNRSEEV